MPINWLIFHDDIAKINRTMEDTRKGALDIEKMLDSKHLRANVGNAKFVIIADDENSRMSCLEEAKVNTIVMGEQIKCTSEGYHNKAKNKEAVWR